MVGKKFRWSPGDFPGRKAEIIVPSRSFLLKVYRGAGDCNRLAVSIGVSAEKKSVRRHFWKRRFMDWMGTWPNLKRDFLIIANGRLRGIDEQELAVELDTAAEKIRRVVRSKAAFSGNI